MCCAKFCKQTFLRKNYEPVSLEKTVKRYATLYTFLMATLIQYMSAKTNPKMVNHWTIVVETLGDDITPSIKSSATPGRPTSSEEGLPGPVIVLLPTQMGSVLSSTSGRSPISEAAIADDGRVEAKVAKTNGGPVVVVVGVRVLLESRSIDLMDVFLNISATALMLALVALSVVGASVVLLTIESGITVFRDKFPMVVPSARS